MAHDFLIIGGGIAGVSAAARLAHLGSVLLLEAEATLAHHASGRSAALYEPHYGNAVSRWLSLASGAYLRGVPGVLAPRGLMILGRADEEAAFAGDVARMELLAVSVEAARAVVPVLNPATVAFAAMADHAWDIDTDLLLQGFAREARGLGATLATRSPVTAITRAGGLWQVRAAGEEHRAHVLVNAAGAWADRIAAMAGLRPLGLQPMRRSMARIPAPGGHDVSRWPMIFGTGEAWYAKPDAGALIVSPAEEHPMDPHDAWADDTVLAEGLARYEAMVSAPVMRLLSNWAGLRTFAPDRALVIGRDAAEPAFFWLAGQGGYGFQSAPAASALAAELLGGGPPETPADLRAAVAPGRFA